MNRQVWLAFGDDSKSPSPAWGHLSKGLATGVRVASNPAKVSAHNHVVLHRRERALSL
jgi:hypothetical protein